MRLVRITTKGKGKDREEADQKEKGKEHLRGKTPRSRAKNKKGRSFGLDAVKGWVFWGSGECMLINNNVLCVSWNKQSLYIGKGGNIGVVHRQYHNTGAMLLHIFRVQ